MAERPAQQLSPGGKILMKSRAAYRALRSYRGSIKISSTAHYPGKKAHREIRQFQIYCKKPARLRLEGKDSNGDPEWIIIRGRKVFDDETPM